MLVPTSTQLRLPRSNDVYFVFLVFLVYLVYLLCVVRYVD